MLKSDGKMIYLNHLCSQQASNILSVCATRLLQFAYRTISMLLTAADWEYLHAHLTVKSIDAAKQDVLLM